MGDDGDDLLYGGTGNDTYFYRVGSGVDTVDNTGGGTDWLYFDGIARNRLSYHRQGDDLVVRVDGYSPLVGTYGRERLRADVAAYVME